MAPQEPALEDALIHCLAQTARFLLHPERAFPQSNGHDDPVQEVDEQGPRDNRRKVMERVSPLTGLLIGRFMEEDKHRGAKERQPLVLVAPRGCLTHTADLAAGRARGNPGRYLLSYLPIQRLPYGATSLFYDVNSPRSTGGWRLAACYLSQRAAMVPTNPGR